jgi:hypothetical protein
VGSPDRLRRGYGGPPKPCAKAEGLCAIANYYWDRAFRDLHLSDADRRAHILKGLEAADQALAIHHESTPALTYKNLLLRLLAATEPDPARRQALLAEADRLRDAAIALQKKSLAGVR